MPQYGQPTSPRYGEEPAYGIPFETYPSANQAFQYPPTQYHTHQPQPPTAPMGTIVNIQQPVTVERTSYYSSRGWPGRSAATASIVLAIMGICVGIIFPALAICCGSMALSRLHYQDPKFLKYRGYAVTGVTLGVVLIIVDILVLILVGVFGGYS